MKKMDEKLNDGYGIGKESLIGIELIYDRQIAFIYEIYRFWVKVGEAKNQLGGEIQFIGFDIWF
ncbi:MAG: hypothetical protein ACE5QV_07140 [Fidelibacterota bacterium]